jgi:glycosyltransferase involved in cell wall biosynthesis
MKGKLNVIFICQTVDEKDPIQATTVRWIKVLSEHEKIEKITVLSLRVGLFNLPKNVKVIKISGANSFVTIVRFYNKVLSNVWKSNTVFFVYQNGYYPMLLLPFRLLLRRPVFQWLAHPHKGWKTWFNLYFGSTRIFTSTLNAFPYSRDNVSIVGQGVNLDLFRPKILKHNCDLITVGRISPVKQLDLILMALGHCYTYYGTQYTLNIVGSAILPSDIEYLEYLHSIIDKYKMSDSIRFIDTVQQSQLPEILPKAKAFIFCCKGALGRSVVEAMSCSIPIISTNLSVAEVVPRELHDDLISSISIKNLSKKIHLLMNVDEQKRVEIGSILRGVVSDNHGDIRLFEKIVAKINKDIMYD